MKEPRYFELSGNSYPLLFQATGKKEFVELWSAEMKELTEQEFFNKLADMNGRVVGRTTIPGLDYTIYGPFAGRGVK